MRTHTYLYIVLNPAFIIMPDISMTFSLYDVFADSNQFHGLDISNSDDIKVVHCYI